MPPVFLFFSVWELPLPLAMAMLSFWKALTNTFECPLPRFLTLGSGKEFPREASERRRNSLFTMISRRGEERGGAWELMTETEMVSPVTGMYSFWKAFTNTIKCPLSRFELGFLALVTVKEFPREASERRRNCLFPMETCIYGRGEEEGEPELRTETEMVSISPKVPEFHFASMMMMASGPRVPEPRTFSLSFSFTFEENGITLSFYFSQGENGITFSFSRARNEITFFFSQAGGHAEPVVGFFGELILIPIPWPADQLGNLHHHLILLLAR
jgi:hypothetical protein